MRPNIGTAFVDFIIILFMMVWGRRPLYIPDRLRPGQPKCTIAAYLSTIHRVFDTLRTIFPLPEKTFETSRMNISLFIISTILKRYAIARTLVDSGYLAYGAISERFAKRQGLPIFPIALKRVRGVGGRIDLIDRTIKPLDRRLAKNNFSLRPVPLFLPIVNADH